MDNRIKKKPYISYSLVVFGILIYVYHATFFFDWIVDDAGISFGFAKNIANGYGAVLNPGSEVVEGYSNPLWVFIISLLIQADLFEPYLATNALGLFFGIVNIIVTYFLTKMLVSNKRSLLNGLPSVFLAFSTPFVAWNLSGLETPLYSLLLVLSVYTYIRELRGESRYHISGFLLFLVAVTRPEAFGYFGLAMGHRLIYSYKKGFDRGTIMWFLSFLAPFGIYHVWHYSYFGFILPNTFYYKAGGTLFSSLRAGVGYVLPFFTEYRMWLLVLFTPVIFIDSIKSHRPILDERFYGRLIVLLMIFGSVVFALATGGDWMMELRFIAPVVPFALILIYIGTRETAQIICRFTQKPNVQIISLALVVILVSGLVIQPSLSSTPEASSDPTVPLDRVETLEERAVSIVEKADISDNATLLTPDMGAHTYYGDLRYVDLAGLADVTIGHHKYKRGIFGDYIFQQKKPTIIKTHGVWTQRSKIKTYKSFQRDYTSIGESDNWFVRKSVFTSPTTEPQVGTNVTLDNSIKFLGYTEQNNITYSGGKIHYIGYWKKLQKTNRSYSVEVRLSQSNNTVARYSRQIIYGWYPASEWNSRETYIEHYKYDVPESIEGGRYNVSIVVESPSSFSKKIASTEILVSGNRSAALARNKYTSISDNRSIEQNLRLAEQAHSHRPGNKTYRLQVEKYENRHHFQQILLAKKSYQKDNISGARKHINKVGDNLLKNETANNIRRKLSDRYVERGDIAKKQGDIRKAYELYENAVAVYGKNTKAIKKRTEVQSNDKIRYAGLIYEEVPQSATSVRVEFSSRLDLVGYNLESDNVESGTEISIEYYFECQRNMRKDYALFSHHEGKDRKVNNRNRFQGDHRIEYPTSKCSSGDIIKTHSFVSTPSINEQTSVVVRMGIWYPNTEEGLEPNVVTGNLSVNNGRVELVEYNLKPVNK